MPGPIQFQLLTGDVVGLDLNYQAAEGKSKPSGEPGSYFPGGIALK